MWSVNVPRGLEGEGDGVGRNLGGSKEGKGAGNDAIICGYPSAFYPLSAITSDGSELTSSTALAADDTSLVLPG